MRSRRRASAPELVGSGAIDLIRTAQAGATSHRCESPEHSSNADAHSRPAAREDRDGCREPRYRVQQRREHTRNRGKKRRFPRRSGDDTSNTGGRGNHLRPRSEAFRTDRGTRSSTGETVAIPGWRTALQARRKSHFSGGTAPARMKIASLSGNRCRTAANRSSYRSVSIGICLNAAGMASCGRIAGETTKKISSRRTVRSKRDAAFPARRRVAGGSHDEDAVIRGVRRFGCGAVF